MTQTDVLYIAGRTDPKYTCINCSRSDYYQPDDIIGMPEYLYCEADTEGILDLERINYAKTCPLFQLIEEVLSCS